MFTYQRWAEFYNHPQKYLQSTKHQFFGTYGKTESTCLDTFCTHMH